MGKKNQPEPVRAVRNCRASSYIQSWAAVAPVLRNADVDTVWHFQRRNEKCCTIFIQFFFLFNFFFLNLNTILKRLLHWIWWYSIHDDSKNVDTCKRKDKNQQIVHHSSAKKINENKINRRKIDKMKLRELSSKKNINNETALGECWW